MFSLKIFQSEITRYCMQPLEMYFAIGNFLACSQSFTYEMSIIHHCISQNICMIYTYNLRGIPKMSRKQL